jgi:hypothetical protein
MAYNTSKGPRNLGDIANETDTDTQIDFGSDSITLKTNNVERLSISNSEVSSSVHFVASSLSASQHISGAAFYGDGSNLTGLTPAAITTYDSAADNRVITSVNSTTVQGESGLTYDGTDLVIVGNASASLGITGSALYTATTTIDSTHVSSSLNMSASAFYVENQIVHTGDPDTYITFTSGYVGIGTLEPNASLTVSGTSPNLRVQDSDTNYAFTIDGTSAGGMMWHIGDMDSSQDSFMTMGAYSGMNRLDTAGRDFHLYGTNTTNGFYFDESLGTFGFGTTSPEKTVTVAGQISASVEISASAFYGDGANLTNLPSNSTGSGDPGGIQFLTSTDGSFMSDGALSFSTGSSGASGTALSCSNLVVGYGLKLPYGVKTSNYSVAISDNIIYMSGSLVNVTASLPAASTVDGSVFYIKNISAHREAEVLPNGSELIDNAALQTLDSTEGIRIQALAAGGGLYTWAIIGVSMPLP